jgi:predicted transglutaminase-like cysteine proteinase
MQIRTTLFLAATLLSMAGPAAARPLRLPFMPLGDRADAPFGFVDMCRRDATDCASPVSEGSAIPLRALKVLRRVNSDVNRHTVQAGDLETSGVDERWQRPNGVGDCEDLAIEKRARLIAGGFPPDRLFLAVAFRRGFGLHTLLIARLPDGDRVLDSLSPHVLRWNQVGYRWLRQQSAMDPMVWRRIGQPSQMADAGTTATVG